MDEGCPNLLHLSTHKFSQDHLELFVNAFCQRHRWSLNPAAVQFCTGLCALMVHADRHIPGSVPANIHLQDDTGALTFGKPGTLDTKAADHNCSQDAQSFPDHGVCGSAHDYVICLSAQAYIPGYYVYSLSKVICCLTCLAALYSSPCDPSETSMLIKIKKYRGNEDALPTVKQGLALPSGSLCHLLVKCEQFFRCRRHLLSARTAQD